MSMKAVILAAGEGSRMRPLTQNKPKVMLPVAGRPILEHIIREMKKAGIDDCIFITGYHEEQIRNYFGDGKRWGVNISYRTQPERLGTADALRMVGDTLTGNFIMANGDIIIDYRDIKTLAAGKETTMGVFRVKNTVGLGLVETRGDYVIKIYEKVENPPSNLANAGLYLFTQDIFQAISDTPLSSRGEFEITHSLQLMIDSVKPVAYRMIERWLDTSYPWDLLSANEYLLKDMKAEVEGEIEENVHITGAVSLGKGSVIRSGSYITGPVIIGEDCAIGPNCYIRPSTSIGNGCHIGAFVELKNSIVMNGSKVPHLSYVGDSVIGESCNLGAGTKIANLKLDKSEIVVDKKATGRRKLGAVIGDGVQTGINSSINVGTVIGSNTRIGPGAVASGIIPSDSKIFQTSRKVGDSRSK
jgi:UDP-N-acetylglucosamine diphosphorylase/glucosamine-1-phosphate N-acetyltransferase